ncbi:unnamed protein product, partial [Dicrocoelium dendriticum]
LGHVHETEGPHISEQQNLLISAPCYGSTGNLECDDGCSQARPSASDDLSHCHLRVSTPTFGQRVSARNLTSSDSDSIELSEHGNLNPTQTDRTEVSYQPDVEHGSLYELQS